MIQIRNLMFQPLTFHLSGGQSLHLTSRAKVTVPDDLVSAELQNAATRGAVELTTIPINPSNAETGSQTSIDEPATASKRRRL